MKVKKGKLDPELQRWVREDASGKRTVMIHIAFSQDPEEAAETLGKMGMAVLSFGPSVVVATSDRGTVMRARRLSWVVRIDLPQQLDLKSVFGLT